MLVILSLTVFVSCKKSTDDSPKTIELLSPTNITETSFTANWNMDASDVKSIFIELATDNNYENIIANIETSANTNSWDIEGLTGATKYYHRLVVEFNDGSIINSGTKSIRTAYISESVMFTTTDDMTIAGKISYLSTNETPKPGIIFMHEMGVFVNNWNSSDVVLGLVAKGYVCLVFDFRGHGNSTPLDDISILLSDKSLIATDLIAAMDFLKNHTKVDSSNIALVGASLGAIMAVAGNGFEEVKTSVSVSGIEDGIYEIFPDLIISSALFMVAENDIRNVPNGNFPEEAQSMYNISQEPKKLIIVPGASAHGTELLASESLINEIINWVDLRFNE